MDQSDTKARIRRLMKREDITIESAAEAAGVEAFILSGYPHQAECDLFARYVLPELDHGRLEFEPDPVAVG